MSINAQNTGGSGKTSMAVPISPNDRIRWLEMLELAAESNPGTMDENWDRLLAEIDIQPDLIPHLITAVRERRWQNAENPRAYVKKVARRLAYKEEVERNQGAKFVYPSSGPERFSLDEALGNLRIQGSAQPSKRSDSVWRRGEGNYDDEDFSVTDISYRDNLLARVPSGFKRLVAVPAQRQAEVERINELLPDFHIHLEPRVEVNWENCAKNAGLDGWECKVLLCKLSQISRDEALGSQPTEQDRKALQAAWRRFDRGGLRKLRDSAKKILPKNVPKRPISDTSK